MRDLQDMSIGQRVILTFVIVLVILLLMALFGYLGGRWDEAGAEEQIEIYAGIPLDRKFLELDRKALDEAYNKHLLLLFSVWLKSGDAEGAKRFSNGMRIARSAFTQAAHEITKREQLSEERDLRRERQR